MILEVLCKFYLKVRGSTTFIILFFTYIYFVIIIYVLQCHEENMLIPINLIYCLKKIIDHLH